MAAQVQGGTASTALKKNKRATVIDLLVKLAHHVHDNCGNNPAVVLSSGFQVAATNRLKSPLAKPVIISIDRSEEHTSELQSRENLVCRLLLEKKKNKY